MATIVPPSELTKKALAWIAEQRRTRTLTDEDRQANARLVEEACVRFNLGPLDAEFLLRTVGSATGPDNAPVKD